VLHDAFGVTSIASTEEVRELAHHRHDFARLWTRQRNGQRADCALRWHGQSM
jgi:hypothetical protein